MANGLFPTDDLEFLAPYYTWAMPYGTIEKWLTSNEGSLPLMHREFAFELQDGSFMRYYSFKEIGELKATVKKHVPISISPGAVYSEQPRRHKKVAPQAYRFRAKELVFDIDLDTYDAIRTCCSGRKLCRLCWRFLCVAVKVVDRALHDDFGFRKVLWIYSGRRGVHAWVCDDIPLHFDSAQRNAILQYLSPVKGPSRAINCRQLWDSSQELASTLISTEFGTIVEEQQLLAKPVQGLVPLLPRPLQLEVGRALEAVPQAQRLSWLESLLRRAYVEEQYPKVLSRLHLSACYPMFDEQVTVQETHLLRLPFSVHPATGKICVPLDVATIDAFDPLSVPNVRDVCAGIDLQKQDAHAAPVLQPYIECFEAMLQPK